MDLEGLEAGLEAVAGGDLVDHVLLQLAAGLWHARHAGGGAAVGIGLLVDPLAAVPLGVLVGDVVGRRLLALQRGLHAGLGDRADAGHGRASGSVNRWVSGLSASKG